MSPTEQWDGGHNYDYFMGRWSRQVADKFLDWLELPVGGPWLDVGCGTGALTTTIATQDPTSKIYAVDPSVEFVVHARDKAPEASLHFLAGSGEALPFASGYFDAVVSGLALNFMPDLRRANAEMLRVTQPGGTVAAYVWDYADKMEWLRYFWDAAVALDSAAEAVSEGKRFPICQPEALTALYTNTGLLEVSVVPLDIPTTFATFEDYWQPFTRGQFPAPAYLHSVDAQRQTALREHLRQTLPSAADGSIRLIARVWAVRGKKVPN